jgi:putative transcriptional regulator
MEILLKCRIKVRLAELEQSQKELAEFMGVSKQTVNGWVTGRVIPPMEKGFQIAKYLGSKVDDLWEYIEE